MFGKGRVGPQRALDGDVREPRLDNDGALITNLWGRCAELALRGMLFHAATAVAGVAPGTAIGTTGPFALANPIGSDVDLIVLLGLMEYVSGTLGIGVVDWIAHDDPVQAAITGTAIVTVNGRLDGPKPRGKALTTATVPTGGKQFRPFADLPPMLASSVLAPWIVRDEVDGAIVIPPGCGVSLQGTAAAGTTPLVRFGALWGERPRS